MARGKKHSPDVVRITDAPAPLSDDITSRQKRYLFSMMIRTVCFIAAAVCGILGVVWLAMIFILGAILLPYVAVVMANASTPKGDSASPFGAVYTREQTLRQLPHRKDL